MAKEYQYQIYGQPSYYNPKERKLNIYFTEPDQGINKETGILLLIAGFGGNANSNIYKKMRTTFSDKYNLVVVQSDYFGWEFMQTGNNISLDLNLAELERVFSKEEVEYIHEKDIMFVKLMEIASKCKLNIGAKENLTESLENYNEMGLIQAIDNISAVISVAEIIKDNGYAFNQDKMIVYGHSHGAYLSYLCNALAPNLFTLLIDNSAWLFPEYLKGNRYLTSVWGEANLLIEFEYLAKTLDTDEEILYLPSLYRKFHNKCDIICYHGINDILISHKEKAKLKKLVKKFKYNEIDEKSIDNIVFKSTQHGLNADFLKLYDYTMERYEFNHASGTHKKNENVFYETNQRRYFVDYSKVVPILHMEKK